MDTIKLEQAERELPELIHRASAGETIIIETPSGERVRLAPEASLQRREREPGLLKGKLTIPPGVFDPMTDEEIGEVFGTEF